MAQVTVEQAAEMQARTATALIAAVDRRLFPFSDIPAAAKLAARIRAGQGLTADEARAAWRLLNRNATALESAGVHVPRREAVSNTVAIAPPQRVGSTRPELAIRSNTRSQKAPYNQHIVVTHSPYVAKDALKSVAYAQWDRVNRWWHTPATPAHAAALMAALEAFDPVPSPRVAALAQEFATLAERRRVLHPEHPDPTFPTAHLVNGSLWPHQMRAVQYLASSSAALFGVRMGGGKSAAAIAAANYVQAARVAVVCPNKVRGVWPREIAKWSAQPWHIVDGTRPAKRRGARRQDLRVSERFEQAEQCLFDCACGAPHHGAVINYEMLVHAPFSTWHPPMPLDLAIYDEIHRVKSSKNTGMSANLATWVDFTTRRIGLSGTPMPQYPWDIFGVYRALDPGIFGPFWTPFKGEYIQMRTREADGQQFPAAILTEARERFATKVHSIMYRPQVDLKLPAVTHYIRQVDLEPEARKEYDRLADDLWADLTTFDRASTGDGADVGDDAVLTPKNVLSRLLRLMQFTGGTVPDDEGVKRRVSTAKADALMEFDGGGPVGGILHEAGCYPGHPGGVEPVCVYAQFRDDLDAIRVVAERAGLRYREISGRRSDGLTDTSELAPDADVVGVQIQAGGTGVDLTRSSVGIWYSKGHSLGDYDQALARQHRPGQARPVTFVHIEATGTVDHDVYRSLMGRRSVVAGVLAIHGLNRASLGGDGNPAAPGEVDTVISDDLMSDGGIRLPIDEFGVDVMGDPRPPAKTMPDTATVEALWLDDVL